MLLGNFREASSWIIKGSVTHSVMYLGKNKFIQAVGDGVMYISLKEIFGHFDTFVLLRILKHTKHRYKIIHKALEFARAQIGMPFNFDFAKRKDSFFCTQLINTAYRKAGYNTGIGYLTKNHSSLKNKLRNQLIPTNFIKGNFRIVLLSHNLRLKGKKLVFVKGK